MRVKQRPTSFGWHPKWKEAAALRFVDGRYECAQCGERLGITAETPVKLILHGTSGRQTFRVILVDGREIHRCAVDERRLA